jgi:cbb3-type cytochrome oxidase subunit 3
MNPVFREASGFVQNSWIMGLTTALFLLCFMGWSWWAYAKHNRQKFEDAAMLPLTTGDDA